MNIIMQQDQLIVWITHHCYFSVAAIPCDVCDFWATSVRQTQNTSLLLPLLYKQRVQVHLWSQASYPNKASQGARQDDISTPVKDNLIYCSNDLEMLREHEKVAPYNSDEAKLTR